MSQTARTRPKLRLVPSKEGTFGTSVAEQEAVDAADGRASERPPLEGFSSSLSAVPDEELVALGVQGSRKALELLYRRHASFAINLAARIEGSSRDTDDIVHDAFIKAFARLRDLTDPTAFRSWLGSIVVRDVRTHLRRARLMRSLGLVRSEPIDLDAVASSDASPGIRAEIAQVYALLRTQPVDDRIAWILRFVEGHELQTVAKMSSCSLATAKRRIARVQAFLNEHFVDAHVEEEVVS